MWKWGLVRCLRSRRYGVRDEPFHFMGIANDRELYVCFFLEPRLLARIGSLFFSRHGNLYVLPRVSILADAMSRLQIETAEADYNEFIKGETNE